MDTHENFLIRKFRKVAELIPENSKVLDVGCNNGRLREFLKNPIYYGVDFDKDMVKNLVKNGIKAKSVDLNKQEIPFKKEKFDFVLLLDILEHVADPKKLLVESKTRLKENGMIIITMPNDYHLLNKLRFLMNKPLTEDPFAPFGHLHFFSIKDGERFLEKCGFLIIKKIYISPTKPSFLPQKIKNFLGKNFPQSFSRDTLYQLEISKE